MFAKKKMEEIGAILEQRPEFALSEKERHDCE
jgi:hypothetical protein